MSLNVPSIPQGFDPRPIGDDPNDPLKEYEIPLSGHEAIDIVGKRGTLILAAVSGKVKESYYEPFYDSRIVIDNGKTEIGQYIRTRYFHLTKRMVQRGDIVHRGQQIGTLGSSGMTASYPHQHIEVRFGDSVDQFLFGPINPHQYWVGGVARPTCFDASQLWQEQPFKLTYAVPCRDGRWK